MLNFDEIWKHSLCAYRDLGSKIVLKDLGKAGYRQVIFFPHPPGWHYKGYFLKRSQSSALNPNSEYKCFFNREATPQTAKGRCSFLSRVKNKRGLLPVFPLPVGTICLWRPFFWQSSSFLICIVRIVPLLQRMGKISRFYTPLQSLKVVCSQLTALHKSGTFHCNSRGKFTLEFRQDFFFLTLGRKEHLTLAVQGG